ncbi:unnamed protein product [Strongylus vulgaris]|uniref:Uncharacterized protein n=1 Tax=Strongylus vulgaris TaxID=40348 RepID=A0A3P7JD97_STRVU|nr:unnamed protein product [Strongylus vulgaris]
MSTLYKENNEYEIPIGAQNLNWKEYGFIYDLYREHMVVANAADTGTAERDGTTGATGATGNAAATGAA